MSMPCLAQIPDHVPVDGLVGYWPFDGDPTDKSQFSNDGVVTGPVLSEDRFGNSASAYEFSNSLDIISFSDSMTLQPDQDFTISYWFKSASDEEMQVLNFNGSGKFEPNLNFAFNNGSGCLTYWNGGGPNHIRFGLVNEFTDNFWHSVAFQRKDTTLRIYFDGRLSGTFEEADVPLGGKYHVTISGGKSPWYGKVDDVVIYNRALTESEIVTLTDQRKITITAPVATDAFPTDFITTVKWLKPKEVGKVKLEYSVNHGSTWNVIKENIDSAVFSYDWPIPNLPDHSCQLRISDINDPSQVAITEPFLISKYKWELVNAKAPFGPRDGAGAYVFKDKMFLVGGWNPLQPLLYPFVTNSEVWESVDGVNWSLSTIAPWEVRHTFGAVVYDDKMWVLGGDQLQCSFQPDVWNCADGSTWNLVSETAPWGERMLHMYAVFDGKMWVMGGQKISYCNISEPELFNDVWNSTDGVTWNLVTDSASWSPRGQIGGYCVFNDKMWILGGGTYQQDFYNDIWNSSDGVNWHQVTKNAPWPSRQYHSVLVFDSAMWVMEGYKKGNRNDVWFTKDGVEWRQLKGTPWAPRHASSVFNFSNSLWIAAGNLWNDVWRINGITCPAMTEHPISQKLEGGDTAQFSARFPTPSPLYQWQVDSGDGWKNLVDDDQFSGSASGRLNIHNVSRIFNGYLIRCIASEGSCSDTSKVATLNVCPTFELQPSDQKINKGDQASFVSGYPVKSGTYQWQLKLGEEWENLQDSDQYSGSLTETLRVRGVSLADNNHQFRNLATVFGSCTDTSAVAVLYVCGEFERQPTDQNIMYGDTAIFSVQYDEGPVAFQWQTDRGSGWEILSDSGQYSGATTEKLVVADINLKNDGQAFSCIVTQGACVSTSATGILTTLTALAVYPNPAENYVIITLNRESLSTTFQVIGPMGRIFLEGELVEPATQVDVSGLPAGFYTVRFGNEMKSFNLLKR